MGRYYSGDIEGKFWFAVQSSMAADRFGAVAMEPNYVQYYFDEDNLPDIEAELEKIRNTLGENLEKLDSFFSSINGYNDDMLVKQGFKKDEIKSLLVDYADYKLGIQIKECIENTGQCAFDAEL